MNIENCPPAIKPNPATWEIGEGAWDCHAHVFGPVSVYPFDANRRYSPPDQTVYQYLNTLDTLKLSMGVLVQPSVYGKNNDALLNALRIANGRLKGVLDIDPAIVSDQQIEEWTQLGACGVRFWWDGKHSYRQLKNLDDRLKETNWHLDVFCRNLEAISDFSTIRDRLHMPVIIEAMGNPSGTGSISDYGFQNLLALLKHEMVWVKLSHPYKIDHKGIPYDKATLFAREIVNCTTDRVVWGSDWPHPMIHGPMPNDGALLDLLPIWTGSEEIARQILNINPMKFYGQSPIIHI